MCISMQPSRMTNTQLYAGEATFHLHNQGNGTYVHVLAYQNNAKAPGPNAMLLPLPARGRLGPDNMLDTRDFPSFLADISNATLNRTRARSASQGSSQSASPAQVFDVGSYTVVLAQPSAGETASSSVAAALERVAPERRPALSEAVLKSFDENYPGWPLAVCCWNGAVAAEPLLWWYEPMNPDLLFAPALDAHDGAAPAAKLVQVDHHVSFGSTLRDLKRGVGERVSPVTYRDKLSLAAQALLPRKVVGTRIDRSLPNGDFVLGVGSAGPATRVAPPALAAKMPMGGTSPVQLRGWP